MHHTKDCCKPIAGEIYGTALKALRPGEVGQAEHAALRDITRPITDHYRGEAWTTALAIVRERMEAAQKNAEAMSVFPVDYDSRAYAEGRYHALRDCLDEMKERGKP